MVAVSGSVEDSSGNPVPHATVALMVGKNVDTTKTARDGSFRVGLAHVPRNAEMNLRVVKGGYKPSENHLLSTTNVNSLVVKLEPEIRPRRTVRGLPRYMTDIPQPIPEEIELADAPKTARDVQCFQSFTPKSTMTDVVKKCGIPDELQGSGIGIFIYNLDDGSLVAVGTADFKRLMYVDHVANVEPRSLLQNNAHP
jgi:hypothetical protein